MKDIFSGNNIPVQGIVDTKLKKSLGERDKKEIGQAYQPKKSCDQSHELKFPQDTAQL
jgi:hypothetical protein